MVVNKDEVLDHLGRLGLSDYEGKVYLSLLQIHPATAYEAARDAGVPTSKVYEVLDRLEGRGMVRAQDESGRKRYLPQPALDFVEAHRRRLGGTLDRLGRDLIRLEAPRDEASVWNLADEAALLDKACRLVQGAAETLLVSAWHAEAAILAPLIRQAADRGVRTALVQFGPGDLDVPRVFQHPLEGTLYAEKGGRELTIVADSREALVGLVPTGSWSLNRGFVALAEDYVKHDIYVLKMVARFAPALQARFGADYAALRDIWTDREEPT